MQHTHKPGPRSAVVRMFELSPSRRSWCQSWYPVGAEIETGTQGRRLTSENYISCKQKDGTLILGY